MLQRRPAKYFYTVQRHSKKPLGKKEKRGGVDEKDDSMRQGLCLLLLFFLGTLYGWWSCESEEQGKRTVIFR